MSYTLKIAGDRSAVELKEHGNHAIVSVEPARDAGGMQKDGLDVVSVFVTTKDGGGDVAVSVNGEWLSRLSPFSDRGAGEQAETSGRSRRPSKAVIQSALATVAQALREDRFGGDFNASLSLATKLDRLAPLTSDLLEVDP